MPAYSPPGPARRRRPLSGRLALAQCTPADAPVVTSGQRGTGNELGARAIHDPRVRSNAVEAIATVHEVRLMPKIQRMLHDSSVQVRFLSALAVGDLEYTLAKDEVTTLLNDPDQNVKMAAAYALLRLGQPEHVVGAE